MRGLVPGIHVFVPSQQGKTWMAGTSPAMTGGVEQLYASAVIASEAKQSISRR
jgi:hypothetical protein